HYSTPATSLLFPLSLHDALPISTSLLDTFPRPTHSTAAYLDCRRGTFWLYEMVACRTAPTGTCRKSANPIYARMPSASTRNLRKDRKSTRLNSSHVAISYAVFCL